MPAKALEAKQITLAKAPTNDDVGSNLVVRNTVSQPIKNAKYQTKPLKVLAGQAGTLSPESLAPQCLPFSLNRVVIN